MSVEKALEDIRKGKIVLVYDFDDRERETDMAIASEFITHEALRTMRNDAGGLVCTTTPYAVAKALGLPFMSDVFYDDGDKSPLLKAMAPTDIPYDNTKSSFGITINHRKPRHLRRASSAPPGCPCRTFLHPPHRSCPP